MRRDISTDLGQAAWLEARQHLPKMRKRCSLVQLSEMSAPNWQWHMAYSARFGRFGAESPVIADGKERTGRWRASLRRHWRPGRPTIVAGSLPIEPRGCCPSMATMMQFLQGASKRCRHCYRGPDQRKVAVLYFRGFWFPRGALASCLIGVKSGQVAFLYALQCPAKTSGWACALGCIPAKNPLNDRMRQLGTCSRVLLSRDDSKLGLRMLGIRLKTLSRSRGCLGGLMN